MKRLLLILGLLISLVTVFAAMSFAQKPCPQEKQMAMATPMDPSMMAIYGLIRSVHGLGGDIKADGGKVSITLNLDKKQLEMLKKALAQPEPMMPMMDMQGKGGMMKGMQGGMCPMMQGKEGGCGMMGEGGCKMMGKDGKCGCCGDDCKMKQGGACDGKCECCKDGCKMMGKDGKGCGMMGGGGCPMMSGKEGGMTGGMMGGGCKMMQGMMGKDGKGCGMMGGMNGMPGMEGMKGMHGMMGGMMGMMPPMDMEITGKCPKCGAEINFMVKCKMMKPQMGEMGMYGMAPPPPPNAPKPEDCKDCENK
jgi:hypothetical protein